jgi:hypothetical protein
MFMCVVNLKSVNKLDLTWKQSFLIVGLEYKGTGLTLTQLKEFSDKHSSLSRRSVNGDLDLIAQRL